MKRFLLSLLVLFLALGAHAQELVTATVTVVDIPNNGDTIVVNGNTRTWTNTPINGVSWIPTTNTLVATTTNLHLHIAATPFTALQLAYTASDAIRLQGSAVSVSFAGTWATVAYSTQAVTSLIAVRVPVAGIPLATNRTFVGVHLLQAINDYATNSFDNNAIALTNFLNLGPASQEVTGPKLFHSISGTNTSLVGGVIDGASITNGTFSGTVILLAGGQWTGGIFVSPTFTNGINYGLAFRSPGTGDLSEQIGFEAEATGEATFAGGNGAKALGPSSTSVGALTLAALDAEGGTVVGTGGQVAGSLSSVFGAYGVTLYENSFTVGAGAQALHTNSGAIGPLVMTTRDYQIKLGNSGNLFSVPGDAHFGQKLAIGSDDFAHWIEGLNRGVAFANGSSPNAPATNSWVAYAEAGQAFYRTGATAEGAEANNRLHNRGATVTGTGTAYSLTASTARVDFSGQDAEILLPTAGTYFVSALVEIVNGATANDEYRLKLRNFEDDVDITDSERAISNMAASVIGQLSLQNVITVTDSKTIVIWGHNATAARGTIAAARTSLSYVRLY